MSEDDYDPSYSHLIEKGANTEIIFAKYRGGSTGTALLKWIGDKTKFIDVEDSSEQEECDVYDAAPVPLGSASEAFDAQNTNKEVPF